MKNTLEVIIAVLEILKEKAEGVGDVAMIYEKDSPIVIYYDGQAEAFETCIKLLKGLMYEEKEVSRNAINRC